MSPASLFPAPRVQAHKSEALKARMEGGASVVATTGNNTSWDSENA